MKTLTARSIRVSLITAIAAGTLITAQAERADAPSVLIVRITAERFQFTPSEITVVPGVVVEFHLSSEDTAHGFRILRHGVDVTIPKRGRGEATVQFTPPEPGTYTFECSRMCGAGHSFMRGTLKVKAETDRSPR